MRVCDLCGKKYHEQIAVFGRGDGPLYEIDLCEVHYGSLYKMIEGLVGKLRAEVLAS